MYKVKNCKSIGLNQATILGLKHQNCQTEPRRKGKYCWIRTTPCFDSDPSLALLLHTNLPSTISNSTKRNPIILLANWHTEYEPQLPLKNLHRK